MKKKFRSIPLINVINLYRITMFSSELSFSQNDLSDDVTLVIVELK
jgi:hypothetical protein